MDELDAHKKESHDGQEIVSKVKLDKHLGVGRKPFKNAILFGLDISTYKIYEVKMDSESVAKIKNLKDKEGKVIIHHKVYIHPDHPLVWASNKKTAMKKFLKLKFKV